MLKVEGLFSTTFKHILDDENNHSQYICNDFVVDIKLSNIVNITMIFVCPRDAPLDRPGTRISRFYGMIGPDW